MAPSFKFAIIRLDSRDARDERINVGIIVFHESGVDVRLTRRLERVRAFSSAIEVANLRDMLSEVARFDEQLRDAGVNGFEDRARNISLLGPLSLSNLGTFSAHPNFYEARLTSILRAMVEPEPAPVVLKDKRSRLLTQLKKHLRSERVMAQKGEDLNSHRILSRYAVDEGLVADLVLKNGAMHVIETVDASGDQENARRALSEIGISALVLERARMRFGKSKSSTDTRLVYNASASLEKIAWPSLDAAANQGAELVNWASQDDRLKLVRSISSVADPIPKKKSGRRRAGAEMARFI